MSACGIAPEDDDGNSARPDVEKIISAISAAADFNALKGHFDAAVKMLGREHRERIVSAKDKRKKELERA